MSFEDVTTHQLLKELANRYHSFGFVGEPKQSDDMGWMVSGSKSKVDALMAAFIGNQTTISAVGTSESLQFLDKAAASPVTSFDQQLQPFLLALGRLFSELVFCGVSRAKSDPNETMVYVIPDPRQASKMQLTNLGLIKKKIASLPLG